MLTCVFIALILSIFRVVKRKIIKYLVFVDLIIFIRVIKLYFITLKKLLNVCLLRFNYFYWVCDFIANSIKIEHYNSLHYQYNFECIRWTKIGKIIWSFWRRQLSVSTSCKDCSMMKKFIGEKINFCPSSQTKLVQYFANEFRL